MFVRNINLVKFKKPLKKRPHTTQPVFKKNPGNNQFFYKNFTFLKKKNVWNTHNKKITVKPLKALLQYSVVILLIVLTPPGVVYLVLSAQLCPQIQYELLIINYLSNSSFENYCIDLTSVL